MTISHHDDEDIPTGVHELPIRAQLFVAGIHKEVTKVKWTLDHDNKDGVPRRLMAIEELIGKIYFVVRVVPAVAAIVLGAFWLYEHFGVK